MDFSEKIDARLDRIERNQLDGKEVLTLDEVVAFTSISKSYWYKITSAGLIRYYKPLGKLIFFKRTDVIEFLLRHPIATSHEIASQAANYLTLDQRAGKFSKNGG